jgi:hypothetical protein
MEKWDKEYTRDYNRKYYLSNKDKIKKKVKEYSLSNKEKVKEYQKEYRIKNKEILLSNRKKWREKNADKNRKYFRERKKRLLKTDPLFKLKYSIRKRTNQAFKVYRWKKDSSNEELLGCSFEEARKQIECLFSEGMNWDNYGRGGWHIDHIKPLSTAKTESDFKELCKIENLQPLWEFDNLSKGSKYTT